MTGVKAQWTIIRQTGSEGVTLSWWIFLLQDISRPFLSDGICPSLQIPIYLQGRAVQC